MSLKYLGIHRGVVMENQKPLQLGRIRALVPDVLGEDTVCNWAMPCMPCHYDASDDVGSALPEIGAGVWIEFECGDLGHPIWVGC